jgi:hypothetical protein
LSWLRILALAALAVVSAFVAGQVKGAGDERARWFAKEAAANLERANDNTTIATDAGQASSDFGDLQLRTRTEAADGRREIERHSALPAQGTVGAGALVDPGLGVAVLCRIERLRALPASAQCHPADRSTGEPPSAVPSRAPAGG